MYCTKCGNEIEDDAVYCNKCGKRVNDQTSDEWAVFSNGLANSSLYLAKVFMWIIGGCMAIACAAAGLGSLVAGCYMLYFYASGSVVAVPLFLNSIIPVTSLHGVALIFSGVTSLFIAIIFAFIVFGLVKSIFAVNNSSHNYKQADANKAT